VCVLISTGTGVFIGTWGSTTDMAKAVTRQVVACWLMSLASTNFLHCLGLPLIVYTHVHEVLVRTDTKVGRPIGHPLEPLVSGLCTLPPHIRFIPEVTLILVEFQISL
jgi:hypothetical protein